MTHGFFILFTAIVTSLFAIHKYHAEQRTSRLQRLYFESTLLDQANVIEDIMSQVNQNYLLVEYMFNLIRHLLDIKSLDEEIKNIFDTIVNEIKIEFSSRDFKKETISILLLKANDNDCCLPQWIKFFEGDCCRTSSYLKGQVLILKDKIKYLNKDNIEVFRDLLRHLSIQVEWNYKFIERHYVLLSLFARLVFEFSSVHYISVENVISIFQEDKCTRKFEMSPFCKFEMSPFT